MREKGWHQDFEPVCGDNLEDFNTLMGHEIAWQVKLAKDEGRERVLILSVGPMGMYRWAVEFLRRWGVDCKHLHGFNMDEWCDEEGNTLPASNPGAFRNAMESNLYGPLGRLPTGRMFWRVPTLASPPPLIPTLPVRQASTIHAREICSPSRPRCGPQPGSSAAGLTVP